MYFAVACDAKSQTRIWPSGCRSLSAIESRVAHFSGVLVLMRVACVNPGLNVDRNTFWLRCEGTDLPNRLYVRLARCHAVIAEDFGRHGRRSKLRGTPGFNLC